MNEREESQIADPAATAEIRQRAAEVRARMESACARVGRDPGSVTLITVVKTFGPQTIRAAHAAGLRHFGESYAQDLRDKATALADLEGVHWHFIGKIQTNKIKYLAGRVELVHAIDRVETASALSARAEGSPVDVLISVNVGGEETKSGVEIAELHRLFAEVESLPGIRLRGLMCLPPWSEDPEDSRPHFRRLRELGETLRGKMREPEVFHLSMGMSHDLEVAIEEGATLVRVGTALLGTRERRQ